METTETTGWWACPGCAVTAEIDTAGPDAVLAGCAQPCPDCGDAMLERRLWEVAA